MLKHIGRLVKNNRKVVLAYKVVPNEPDNCIVVTTENLMADEHDSLMRLVESNTGQEADDLATAMTRTSLPDGKNMLYSFHQTGKLIKIPTKEVEMLPSNNSSIRLNELNEAIAKNKGVTVADLALGGDTNAVKDVSASEPAAQQPTTAATETPASNEPLSDESIAKNYRSQAYTMFKEAKRLREEAEKLSPSKKASKNTTEANDSE